MRAKRIFVWALLVSLLLSLPVVAQDSDDEATAIPEGSTVTTDAGETTGETDDGCPALVQTALDLTERRCEIVGGNQVCYGHSDLRAASRPDAEDFEFDEPGDIEDVIRMQSLSLSAMDVALEIWGVMLMRVQAAVAGSAVDNQENITFVVFGDARVDVPLVLFNVQVTENTNVRTLPEQDSGLLSVLSAGQTITANGRTEDGEWIRVRLPDIEAGSGWIAADLVESEPDLASLVPVPPEIASQAGVPPSFGPMQAFYFSSAQDDAPCREAPNSGMLIQTPEGAASVSLWIDEVIIELDATAYLRAQPDGNLQLDVLEGSAQLTAFGETRTAIAGTQVSVPLDADLGAADVPGAPVPSNADDLAALPVVLLDTPVEIPQPRTILPGVPAAGAWSFAWDMSELTCPNGRVVAFESSGTPSSVSVAGDGGTLSWGGRTYSRQSEGVYNTSYLDGEGNLYQETLRVEGLDRISGATVIDFNATVCTLEPTFRLQLVRAE